MRVTITHPTINRRKTFTRAQRDDALRHLAVGWNITDPDEQDLEAAFDIAEGVDIPEGNIASILDWVDEDPHRAESALAAERSAPNSRSTLITQLETIAAGDTDNAPQGEEE